MSSFGHKIWVALIIYTKIYRNHRNKRRILRILKNYAICHFTEWCSINLASHNGGNRWDILQDGTKWQDRSELWSHGYLSLSHLCVRVCLRIVQRQVFLQTFNQMRSPTNQLRTPFFVPSLVLPLFLYQWKSFSRRRRARKFLIVSILIVIWFIRRHPLNFTGHFKKFSDPPPDFDYSEICARQKIFLFFEKCPPIGDFQ